MTTRRASWTLRLACTLALLAAVLYASMSTPATRVSAQTAGSVLTVGQYQIFEQPDAHLSPVLQLIRKARKSIRLEVYLLTDRSIVAELQKARQRGVDVRVLLEQRPYGAGRYAQLGYSHLQAAGVPVRWANEAAFTYTHEKSMEVDGALAGIFTFNFSSSGFLSNREFGLIEQSSTDARAIGTIFDADWNRQKPKYTAPDLVISPYNSRHVFTTLIDSARHTLDLYAEEVNDSAIEGLLASAVKRGVRVRLIVPSSSPGVDTVRGAGVAVKLQPHPYVHAKAIVADGHAFYIGSENISGTSLDKNREAGITLDNRTLAQFVESVFASDWGGAPSSRTSSGSPPPSAQGSGNLAVRVTAVPTSVAHGGNLTIRATTRRGAACTVEVIYPNGYRSHARTLAAQKVAGSSGTVSWSFSVGTKSSGAGKVSVRCTLGSAAGTGTVAYEVQ
ncbi:MAG TPA: phospholipase D-like domain-containing protein [Chloroflexota bacterium]